MGVFIFAVELKSFSEDILYFVFPIDFDIKAIGSTENKKEPKNNTTIEKKFVTESVDFLLLFFPDLIQIELNIKHR